MPYKVAISIINYRTGEMTLDCVRSVLADMAGIDAQIVVVDNNSGDGSADLIGDWIAAQPAGTPVTLVRSATNSGFSGGHNQGIGACMAEYYLVLNSDALLRPGFLKTILAVAEVAPTVGLISPQILEEDGSVATSRFRFHNPLSEFIRGAHLSVVTRALQGFEVPIASDNPAAADWVSFACVLLRGDMVRDLGPMDEGYFLYFEDSEYCLRARRRGWGIALAPEAVAVHFQGKSGPVTELIETARRVPKYYYSSRTRFFYQAHGWPGLIGANLLWHAGRVVSQLRRLFGKAPGPANTSEWRDIWTNAHRPLGPDFAPHKMK